MSTYAAVAAYPANAVIIAGLFGVLGIGSSFAWAAFGAVLQKWLKNPKIIRTFNIVMALLLVILGPLTIVNTAKDIFPNIGIPVVSVIWTYSGLPPEEMSGRITGSFERVSLVAVNNIDHIESQSVTGISVIKYFFHQGTNVDLAMSQVTAVSQTFLRSLPPGSSA